MTNEAGYNIGGPKREIALEQGGGKPAILNCPECGAENIQGTDYCVNCNSDLRTLDIPPETWAPGEGPPGERVQRLVHADPLTVGPQTPLREVIERMREMGHGCALITEHGRVLGVFTERDLLHRVTPHREAALARPVSELMTPNPVTMRPDESILVALNEMGVGGFRHIPLVDEGGELRGILTGRDVLEYIEQRARPS
jgi:CBS domain-containing protein